MRTLCLCGFTLVSAGMSAAATPETGFYPHVTREKCLIMMEVAGGGGGTAWHSWDQPCAPGEIVSGQGTLTTTLDTTSKEPLVGISTGTLVDGFLDGKWNVGGGYRREDGSIKSIGAMTLTMKMGCALDYDGKLSRADCVPGTALPKPQSEEIAISEIYSFADTRWIQAKAAAKPTDLTIKTYWKDAFEAPFCISVTAAPEGPGGQEGDRLLANTCAVKVEAAWCIKGETKSCEAGYGYVQTFNAHEGVVIAAENAGEIVSSACTGQSIRPVVTESGLQEFYCD